MGLFSKKKDGPKDGDAIPGHDPDLSLRVATVFAKVSNKLDDLPPSEDLDLTKERAFLSEREGMLLGLAPRGDYGPLLTAFADYGERVTGDLVSLSYAHSLKCEHESIKTVAASHAVIRSDILRECLLELRVLFSLDIP